MTSGRTPSDSNPPTEQALPQKLIFGMLGVAGISIVVIVAFASKSQKEATTEIQRLTQLVDMQISIARTEIDLYEFDAAKHALDEAYAEVETSVASTWFLDEQVTKIGTMLDDVQTSETDYRDRVDDGWIIYDDELVPPSVVEEYEREQELFEAEAERQRLEERNRQHRELREERKNASGRSTIGSWIVIKPRPGGMIPYRLSIVQQGEQLFLEEMFMDGSGPLRREMVEVASRVGRRFEYTSDRGSGEYWFITPNGDLQERDRDGPFIFATKE